MLIKVTRDLAINPEHVASLAWDRRDYAYGPSNTKLIIRMADGSEYWVEHQPHLLDGADAYAVERQIMTAQEAPDATV